MDEWESTTVFDLFIDTLSTDWLVDWMTVNLADWLIDRFTGNWFTVLSNSLTDILIEDPIRNFIS